MLRADSLAIGSFFVSKTNGLTYCPPLNQTTAPPINLPQPLNKTRQAKPDIARIFQIRYLPKG